MTKEYRAWLRMKHKCLKLNTELKVCSRWINSFDNFEIDRGYAPTPRHRLIRINPQKGFSPDNCKWLWGNEYIVGSDVSYICISDNKNSCTLLIGFDTTMIEKVYKYQWFLHRKNGVAKYVITSKNQGVPRLLHQLILPKREGFLTDHINGDGLDNRSDNLRYANHETNGINRHITTGKSKYRGVYFHKATGKWAAQIGYKNKINLGLFPTEETAAKA